MAWDQQSVQRWCKIPDIQEYWIEAHGNSAPIDQRIALDVTLNAPRIGILVPEVDITAIQRL